METDQKIAGMPVREISAEPGVIEICGMKYSSEIFQHCGGFLQRDGWFRITKREDGIVHIEWKDDAPPVLTEELRKLGGKVVGTKIFIGRAPSD